MVTDLLLTVDEVAELLHISRREVLRLTRKASNPLPALKLGHKTIRIEQDGLRAWLESVVARKVD
jgi:excisionase family DNA binding protein